MSKKIFIVFPVLLLFFFSLFVGIDRFIHRKSLRFSLARIALAYESAVDEDTVALTPEEKAELDSLFSRSFTFFGKSNHAYLFLSEDHKYVLKFLKRAEASPKSWLAYIPFSFNPYYQDYRRKKAEQKKTHSAYQRAFREFKEETGLVYMHLSPTHIWHKKISIFDKNGKLYAVELDKTSFYVQKRAQLIYPRIAELMRMGDIAHAKNIIASVFSLIDYLGKNGICDQDLSLYNNFGIIDDKAVQLAISKLAPSFDHCALYKKNIPIVTEPFRRWINKNYPELLSYFDDRLILSLASNSGNDQSQLEPPLEG
jgi:hypothetical protein